MYSRFYPPLKIIFTYLIDDAFTLFFVSNILCYHVVYTLFLFWNILWKKKYIYINYNVIKIEKDIRLISSQKWIIIAI